jgi:hypothetical protein
MAESGWVPFKDESPFVSNGRLTPMGSRLIRTIDGYLAAKKGMTDELRHYSAAVYRARLMKPAEWLQPYPDTAQAVGDPFFTAEDSDDELASPPPPRRQPFLRLD